MKNIILCLKYPFLWPRNRFTGLHYNNWRLLDWVNRMKAESSLYTYVSLRTDDFTGSKTTKLEGGRELTLEIHDREIWFVLSKEGSHWEKVLSKVKIPCRILDAAWGGEKERVVHVKVEKELEDRHFISIPRMVYSKTKYALSKIVEWYHSSVLQVFHCYPSYTELDALDKGWRIRFGEEMCKEIRKALWKEGGLKAIFGFRIEQIKEKYGSLRFYCHPCYMSVMRIIDQYESLSERTCIVCGKPAEWISRGWVSPYCDEHIGDKDYADKISPTET